MPDYIFGYFKFRAKLEFLIISRAGITGKLVDTIQTATYSYRTVF